MEELSGWIAIIKKGLQYIRYRCGFGPCPTPFDPIYPEGSLFFRRIYRWDRYMRVEGAENLPFNPPVMFVANHIRFDDPITMFLAIGQGTKGAYYSRFMMRTGAFEKGTILKSWLIDLDELASLIAAIQFDRDNITWKQLKPFVQRLVDGLSLAMYIGRTRSRTGIMIEYFDFDEPGAPSFLIAQAQKKRGTPIPAIPLARTFDPITKGSVFHFGHPRYLDENAGRDAQRDFDISLIEDISRLIEVNMGHIVAGLLYNHCLMGGKACIREASIRSAVGNVVSAICNLQHAPELDSSPEAAYQRVMRFLEKKNIVTRDGRDIALAKDLILCCPPLKRGFVKQNPIKFLVNQVLHYPAFVEAIESQRLN